MQGMWCPPREQPQAPRALCQVLGRQRRAWTRSTPIPDRARRNAEAIRAKIGKSCDRSRSFQHAQQM